MVLRWVDAGVPFGQPAGPGDWWGGYLRDPFTRVVAFDPAGRPVTAGARHGGRPVALPDAGPAEALLDPPAGRRRAGALPGGSGNLARIENVTAAFAVLHTGPDARPAAAGGRAAAGEASLPGWGQSRADGGAGLSAVPQTETARGGAGGQAGQAAGDAAAGDLAAGDAAAAHALLGEDYFRYSRDEAAGGAVTPDARHGGQQVAFPAAGRAAEAFRDPPGQPGPAARARALIVSPGQVIPSVSLARLRGLADAAAAAAAGAQGRAAAGGPAAGETGRVLPGGGRVSGRVAVPGRDRVGAGP